MNAEWTACEPQIQFFKDRRNTPTAEDCFKLIGLLTQLSEATEKEREQNLAKPLKPDNLYEVTKNADFYSLINQIEDLMDALEFFAKDLSQASKRLPKIREDLDALCQVPLF